MTYRLQVVCICQWILCGCNISDAHICLKIRFKRRISGNVLYVDLFLSVILVLIHTTPSFPPLPNSYIWQPSRDFQSCLSLWRPY